MMSWFLLSFLVICSFLWNTNTEISQHFPVWSTKNKEKILHLNLPYNKIISWSHPKLQNKRYMWSEHLTWNLFNNLAVPFSYIAPLCKTLHSVSKYIYPTNINSKKKRTSLKPFTCWDRHSRFTPKMIWLRTWISPNYSSTIKQHRDKRQKVYGKCFLGFVCKTKPTEIAYKKKTQITSTKRFEFEKKKWDPQCLNEKKSHLGILKNQQDKAHKHSMHKERQEDLKLTGLKYLKPEKSRGTKLKRLSAYKRKRLQGSQNAWKLRRLGHRKPTGLSDSKPTILEAFMAEAWKAEYSLNSCKHEIPRAFKPENS